MTASPYLDPQRLILGGEEGIGETSGGQFMEEILGALIHDGDLASDLRFVDLLTQFPDRVSAVSCLADIDAWESVGRAMWQYEEFGEFPPVRRIGLFAGGFDGAVEHVKRAGGDGRDWPILKDAKSGQAWTTIIDIFQSFDEFEGLFLADCRFNAREHRGHKVPESGPYMRLIHHFPVAEPAAATVAAFPNATSPVHSILRSLVCSKAVEVLRWPLSWDDAEVERITASLTWWHRAVTIPSDIAPTGLMSQDELATRLLGTSASRSGVASSKCELPAPRLVKSHRQAEEYVAEIMSALGQGGVRVTPAGADGGVDVRTDAAVVQVKMEGVRTGRPVVQAIFGVATLEQRAAVCFSLAGFTREAVEWANRARVACFEFQFDGSVVPVSMEARSLLFDAGIDQDS